VKRVVALKEASGLRRVNNPIEVGPALGQENGIPPNLFGNLVKERRRGVRLSI
jgi:hypothetical protein